jgi:MYXO-CTERM domain-containing protein
VIRRVLPLAAVAWLVTSSARASACPVAAYNGTQPCNDAMNALFEKATGPGLGAAGPALPSIHDGCGKPKPSTSVPFHMPCVLAKAIGLTESSWRQFKVGACGQVGPTVVSFDCGYGIMQITSGMSGGAGFDPVRVSQEPGYNLGTGLKMMGGKWAATPCVGDNEVAVMEDWYYAVWAYNGFCYCNNPNNSNFPSPRPPFNGPGSLSRGSYPYQEIVWGLVQYPYGGTYPGQPISYPSKAAIGSSAPAIPAPSPVHSGDCGPVIPPHPDMFPSIAWEGLDDRFADASSQGIADAMEGQGFTTQLYVKNQGDAPASAVKIKVWIEDPFLEVQGYEIDTDWKHPGQFTVNDANDNPANPAHDAPPGQVFELDLYAISPGETKRISLDTIAKSYSIGLADHPDVRFWVEDVPDFYHQDDFNQDPSTSKLQSFGKRLQVYAQSDVYSPVHWAWNSDVLEGWSAGGGAKVAVDLDEHAIAITATGDDPQAASPDLGFSAKDNPSLRMRAKRTGGKGTTRLYFATDQEPALDETKVIDVGLPDDGAYHDLTIPTGFHAKWTGTITKLRLDPFESGDGEVLVDDLRTLSTVPGSDGPMTAGAGGAGGANAGSGNGGFGLGDAFAGNPGDPAADPGCTCRAAGAPSDHDARGLVLLLGAAAFVGARSRRRRPRSSR